MSDEALADRGHLELELHELRIEEAQQDVVGALAVDHRDLEVLVVQALLQARPGRDGGNPVYSSAARLHVVEGRRVPCAEAGGDHLRDAGVGGPGETVGLLVPQLPHGEVSACRHETVIGDDLSHLPPVGQAGELGVAIGEHSSIASTPMSVSIFSSPAKLPSLIRARCGYV